jgi:hypothetical protein
MDIAKIAWQARIASRHLDRRTIAVPESMLQTSIIRPVLTHHGEAGHTMFS